MVGLDRAIDNLVGYPRIAFRVKALGWLLGLKSKERHKIKKQAGPGLISHICLPGDSTAEGSNNKLQGITRNLVKRVNK